MEYEITTSTPETMIISSYLDIGGNTVVYTDFSLLFWFLGVELILLLILIFKRR